MTAFSRKNKNIGAVDLTWEIRSVNHRHLDINLYFPDRLSSYEHSLKELIQKKLSRGKLDLKMTLAVVKLNEVNDIVINEAKVKSLLNACSRLKQLTHKSATLSAMEILQWPGVMEQSQSNSRQDKELFEASYLLLEATLDEMIAMREREGTRLLEMIAYRCEAIVKIVSAVKKRRVEVVQALRAKVMNKISELDIDVNENRLEQELVYHAQRLDVDEELDRIGAHIAEINDVLTRKEPVGRRLDFLMQELNREANTLASKSNDTKTTKSAVELKVLIEQMREQCLNIE